MSEQAGTAGRILVSRPCLPDVEALIPYLREIDAARWYTNTGPLTVRFAGRLGDRVGVGGERVALVANATLGLALALATVAKPQRRCCIVPAWTFAATAHAVRNAGLEPWFVDVDRGSWALTPDMAHHALTRAPARIAAVVPVAPFGAPVDGDGWLAFQDETGIPVVVDAAASFDTLRPGKLTTVLSLHATKALGIGEGGAVFCPDEETARRIRQASNQGFYGRRVAEIPGTNAKLSEYHAAVGLAALELWPATRDALMRVAETYRDHLKGIDGVALQEGFGDTWIGTTCMALFSGPWQVPVAEELARQGVETRTWWGDGPARHPCFDRSPREDAPNTAYLASHTLGLPFMVDLSAADIMRICDCVRAAIAGIRSTGTADQQQ